jgi:hypothetical protein
MREDRSDPPPYPHEIQVDVALGKLLAQLGQHVGAGRFELVGRLQVQDQRLGIRCRIDRLEDRLLDLGWR